MELALPTRLNELLAAGAWPANRASELRQNLQCLVTPERVRAFAPEEDYIYLHAPPFRTIADEIAMSTAVVRTEFWEKFGALHGIVPERALILGDFGLGSDAPIVLNYALNLTNPPVFRLRWQTHNEWVQGARTFDEFVNILGLAKDVA